MTMKQFQYYTARKTTVVAPPPDLTVRPDQQQLNAHHQLHPEEELALLGLKASTMKLKERCEATNLYLNDSPMLTNKAHDYIRTLR
jgi:hypothetical protein